MKFSRLRLVGFKSFVEPTDVPIEPGLTGIVGPNGCGKSNLAEALQWVMGEASYKAMRASAMEDVIFSGSGARPARNAAEVTLSLDNSDRSAPPAFNDSETLEITRRIERDAGSSYRINGREVRARDVQTLFADASAGAHSPAMVGQGRVGALIAAKPEARRAILEEAAGISGLFSRRHEAELRLKAAEQNLERVEDVLGEIERQLEALRRQARQATRYRTLSAEIRKGETTALAVRYAVALQVRTEAETELAAATLAVTERGEAHARASRDQAVAAAALPDLRDHAVAAGAAIQRIRIEADRLDGEERAAAAQIAETDRRIAQLRADLERERRLLADNVGIIARLGEEEATLTADQETAANARAAAADRVAAGAAALAAREAETAEAQNALTELRAQRARLEREVADGTGREARIARELAEVERERSELGGAETTRRIEEAAARVQAAVAATTGSEANLHQAETNAEAARGAEATARASAAEAETMLARVEAEAKALRSLLPRGAIDDPIADLVAVRDGGEAALAAAFGDELETSQAPGAPSHWRSLPAAIDDPRLPDGVQPLAAFVDAPAALARRLAQTGIVAREDGLRLQSELRPGQSLASREGDLWRWDGFVATADAHRERAARIAGRKRLAELNAKLTELRQAARPLADQLGAARVAAEQAGRNAGAARDGLRQARQALEAGRSALAAAERDHARIGNRHAALSEAQDRLQRARAEAAAALRSAVEALQKLAPPSSLELPLHDLRQRLAADRAATAEGQAALARLDRDAEHRRQRLSSIGTERRDWLQRRAGAEAQIGILARRIGEAEAERAERAGLPAEVAVRRTALAATAASAEVARATAADALAGAEAVAATAERSVRGAGESLSEARERRGRAEERAGGARQRVGEFADRIREVLQCQPEEATAAAGLSGHELPALDQVEARVERLKDERERLGGVNLQAEQEANEIAERRTTMIADRDDLVAAIQKLRQAIGSLNGEGRQRLLAAFASVNEKFRELFTHLFGGGTAELQLTDAADPLEAGLEIIARPPGKKPQTMTLLSGGEQALTALSLIFAVFITNPAPICVLDEVDAPLDDANVERFCALIEEVTRRTETRFLVVTHNPITMSRMSRLFGVTMAERGVSQLVSVDLETAERFREAG